MKRAANKWYIDVRPVASSEALSFDLSQQLPRRLRVGPVLVVHDNPSVFLSVIRKKWMALLKDIERLYARTLDRRKRDSFIGEISHLKACRFTSKSRLLARSDALFVNAQHVSKTLPSYATAYVTQHISPETLAAIVGNLCSDGVLVVYGEWSASFDAVLRNLA